MARENALEVIPDRGPDDDSFLHNEELPALVDEHSDEEDDDSYTDDIIENDDYSNSAQPVTAQQQQVFSQMQR